MNTVIIPESEYEELKRLSHYFSREDGGFFGGGSEVDRLKTIIHQLDKSRTQALLERNAVWAAITEAESKGHTVVPIASIKDHEAKLKEKHKK